MKPRSALFLVVVVLLASACAPASTASPTGTTAPEQPPPPTPTEEPVLTAEATEISGPFFTNPVYERNFPDPHVILVGDTYYAYSTNDYPSNIPALRSTDLFHWEPLGDVLPALPEWSVLQWQYVWAPGIIQIHETFLLYYVGRDKEADRQCIGLAVSEDPAGPFVDEAGQPMICQVDLGGSIDPYPFRDDDGRLYLLWKNDGNCCGLRVSIWIQELSPDGRTLQGEPVELIRRDQPWEVPLVENPALVKHNNQYYLFYSASKWDTPYYAIGYAVCETVLGPCVKPLREPWLKHQPHATGPGGQSFFEDTEGNLWMAYHAWTGANIGNDLGQRSFRIDLVTFEDGKPVTNGPTSGPQPMP